MTKLMAYLAGVLSALVFIGLLHLADMYLERGPFYYMVRQEKAGVSSYWVKYEKPFTPAELSENGYSTTTLIQKRPMRSIPGWKEYHQWPS